MITAISDIELEVRCLRKWLKEMEQRIDPLQFNKIAEWSTRDRERKMAEYQVSISSIDFLLQCCRVHRCYKQI